MTATFIQQVPMTLGEWIAIPNNPRQRNTERHLAKAKHLFIPSPTHAEVAMAYCCDGRKWKLDGHTRTLLWEKKPEVAPKAVRANCYLVESEEEAKDLYSTFDNTAATETGADKLYGALHASEVYLTSSLLTGSVSSALYACDNLMNRDALSLVPYTSIYDVTPRWKSVLETVDEWQLSRDPFPRPIAVALLISTLIDPQPVFWAKYNEDAGTKNENGYDAVEALRRIRARTKGMGAASAVYSVAGQALQCLVSYKKNKIYALRGSAHVVDLREYVKIYRDTVWLPRRAKES